MAKKNLTEPAGELTRMALAHLEHSDGVNEDEPHRITDYPEGTIGWYADLVARLQKAQPDLVPEAKNALAAATGYRDWLRQIEPTAKGPAAIGLDNFNWYVEARPPHAVHGNRHAARFKPSSSRALARF